MNPVNCFFTVRRLRLTSMQNVARAMRSTPPAEDSPFLRLGWQLEAGGGDLPDWFEANRVQADTRLHIEESGWGLDTPAFQAAAAQFSALGARVYARHVKRCSQIPYWPTAVPVDDNGAPLWNGVIADCETGDPVLALPADRNVVQEMVAEAHDQGVRLLAYYWHMSERLVSDHYGDQNSEWVCKRRNCTATIPDGRRAPWLDLSKLEYRDIVLRRLLELAAMGVDGFYFDARHLPKEGCWCSALAKAYTAETGAAPPTNTDLNDPLYRQFLDFKAYKIEEAFAFWKRRVKEQFPHVVFIISATGIPVPHSRYETTNLVRLADSAKNEYKHALQLPEVETFFAEHGLAEPDSDMRQAFGWVLLRDAAEGRPPHIWERAYASGDQARAAAAALVTYGGIANMNVDEHILAGTPAPDYMTPRAGLEAAFALGRQVSPYLAHSRPVRWAAVHFSELARNRRGGDLRRAWQEVLWPAMGAYGVMVRVGVPVGIVDDYHLEHDQVAGYQVLYLSNPTELTSAQKDTVRRFVGRGGILLRIGQGLAWSNPGSTGTAARGFLRFQLQPLIDCFPPPVQVSGNAATKMHAVAFEDPSRRRLLVAVSNDFSWVQWVTDDRPPENVNQPPSPISAVVQVTNRRPPVSIVEAITGTTLDQLNAPNGYRVRLPQFTPMALLVVQE